MDDEGLHSYKAIAFITSKRNQKRSSINKKLAVTLQGKILTKQKINRVFSKLGEIYG
jgi:hypothetical protein